MIKDSKKILIVEDDEDVLEMLQEALEAEEGFKVDCVGSGEEAVELLKTNHYDVAVLDLVMPGLGGEDVLRAILRQQGKTSVVIFTGLPEGANNARGVFVDWDFLKQKSALILTKGTASTDLMVHFFRASL